MRNIFKDLEKKNIVITGGSGFLGSQITKAFIKTKIPQFTNMCYS